MSLINQKIEERLKNEKLSTSLLSEKQKQTIANIAVHSDTNRQEVYCYVNSYRKLRSWVGVACLVMICCSAFLFTFKKFTNRVDRGAKAELALEKKIDITNSRNMALFLDRMDPDSYGFFIQELFTLQPFVSKQHFTLFDFTVESNNNVFHGIYEDFLAVHQKAFMR